MSEHSNKDEPKGFILVVDDVPHNLQVLCNMLGKERYRIAVAQSGQQALDMIDRAPPDLILLDVLMPGISGFEVCKKLKSSPDTREIPVIFLTAKTDLQDVVKGFELGAVNYFTKPFNETELLVVVKTHLELKTTREKLAEMQQQLNETRVKLERAIRTDPLTNLINRQGILEYIKKEKSRFQRNKTSFNLILANLDDFSLINGTYGEDCGNYILNRTAREIESHLSEPDYLSRWGGDEFLILLPDSGPEEGEKISEKIRIAVSNQTFHFNNKPVRITLTIGVGTYGKDFFGDLGECIKTVLNAVATGKKEGKNRVIKSIDS